MNKIDLIIESYKKFRERKKREMSQQVKDLKSKADLYGLRGDSPSQKAKKKAVDSGEKLRSKILSRMSKKQKVAAGEFYRPARKLVKKAISGTKKNLGTAVAIGAVGYAGKKYGQAKSKAAREYQKAREKIAKKKTNE